MKRGGETSISAKECVPWKLREAWAILSSGDRISGASVMIHSFLKRVVKGALSAVEKLYLLVGNEEKKNRRCLVAYVKP